MSESASHQLFCDDCRAGRPCADLLRLFDVEAISWVRMSAPRPRAVVPVESNPVPAARTPLYSERARLAQDDTEEPERARAGVEDDA